MTQYACGNCRELSNLSPRARFCPVCGSTSLILIVKEQAEPAARETIGVYTPEPEPDTVYLEEEDQPSQRSKRS